MTKIPKFIILALFINALATVAFAENKIPATIVPYDMIAFPGIEVWPQARVIAKRFLTGDRPVGGERIEFIEGDRYLGLALTGGDGVGVIRYIPYSGGMHQIKLRLMSSSAYEAEEAEALIAVWDRSRPLLLVSLDALREPSKEVVFPFIGKVKKDTERRPAVQSVDVLAGLSDRYRIVYLYGGDLSHVKDLKSWLHENRFPAPPLLIFEDGTGVLKRLISQRRKEIKGVILTTNDDEDVFKREGIKMLLLVEKKKRGEYKGDSKEKTIVSDWGELKRKID